MADAFLPAAFKVCGQNPLKCSHEIQVGGLDVGDPAGCLCCDDAHTLCDGWTRIRHPDLACLLPNCVSSRGNSGITPLLYVGTPAQAMAVLEATLLTFPEATVVRSEFLAMEVMRGDHYDMTSRRQGHPGNQRAPRRGAA